jgi:hypothetical protein
MIQGKSYVADEVGTSSAPSVIVHWGSNYLGVEGPCSQTVPTTPSSPRLALPLTIPNPTPALETQRLCAELSTWTIPWPRSMGQVHPKRPICDGELRSKSDSVPGFMSWTIWNSQYISKELPFRSSSSCKISLELWLPETTQWTMLINYKDLPPSRWRNMQEHKIWYDDSRFITTYKYYNRALLLIQSVRSKANCI